MKSNKIKFSLDYSAVKTFLQTLQPCLQEGDDTVYVIGNQRFINSFQSHSLSVEGFKNTGYRNLEYGIVILVEADSIEIYNDVFGGYPLFKTQENDQAILSNFLDLSKESVIDTIAIIEFIHFNHVLGNRTLSTNTKRIPGASKISINAQGYKDERLLEWSDLEAILFDDEAPTPSEKSWSGIDAFISSSKTTNPKDVLTLTGGFDSRLIMAVMLNAKSKFSTITWGQSGNLQTKTAEQISKDHSLEHREVKLDDEFQNEINTYLDYIVSNGSESPFIIDIPQFVHMCRGLEKDTNLISGFMGSEIIRGPSYSSQVTLTKFAADIGLAKTKEEIKLLIQEFQTEYPFLDDTVVNQNIDELVDLYADYSKIGKQNSNRNTSIFKYLFLEKYPKIYGPIVKFHQDQDINLINPFMSIDFIKRMLRENKAKTDLTPYEGNAFYNYKLYKYYAIAINGIYPPLNKTYVDRGYKIADLISPLGLIKLPLFQIYRKYLRKHKVKETPTVDSKKWYQSHLEKNAENLDERLLSIINNDTLKNINQLNSVHSIKSQLILGLNKKLKA